MSAAARIVKILNFVEYELFKFSILLFLLFLSLFFSRFWPATSGRYLPREVKILQSWPRIQVNASSPRSPKLGHSPCRISHFEAFTLGQTSQRSVSTAVCQSLCLKIQMTVQPCGPFPSTNTRRNDHNENTKNAKRISDE